MICFFGGVLYNRHYYYDLGEASRIGTTIMI